MLQRWVSVAAHAQPEAPVPPDYAACVKYLAISTGAEPSAYEPLRSTCRQSYKHSLEAALETLVHTAWLLGEAAREGVRADGSRLVAETATGGAHGEEVKRTLAETSQTVAELKLTLARLSAQLSRRLKHREAVVTNMQVADYYKRHRERFVIPPRRDLYVVRLNSLADAKKAKREIERGVSFASIAEGTRLQPIGTRAGLLRGLEPQNWPERPLGEDVFRAPLNTLTGPVQNSLGYYVFKVIGKTPSRRLTLDQARLSITRLLGEEIALRYRTDFRERWAARTECFRSALSRYCWKIRHTRTTPLEPPPYP